MDLPGRALESFCVAGGGGSAWGSGSQPKTKKEGISHIESLSAIMGTENASNCWKDLEHVHLEFDKLRATQEFTNCAAPQKAEEGRVLQQSYRKQTPHTPMCIISNAEIKSLICKIQEPLPESHQIIRPLHNFTFLLLEMLIKKRE